MFLNEMINKSSWASRIFRASKFLVVLLLPPARSFHEQQSVKKDFNGIFAKL